MVVINKYIIVKKLKTENNNLRNFWGSRIKKLFLLTDLADFELTPKIF